jgi:hypothetical protein
LRLIVPHLIFGVPLHGHHPRRGLELDGPGEAGPRFLHAPEAREGVPQVVVDARFLGRALQGLTDPNFKQSVVLLLQQSDDGALGLVINRESPILLRDLCKDHEISYVGDPAKKVRVGGPVQPEQGLVLYDGGVVKRLNGQFVPIKLDGNKFGFGRVVDDVPGRDLRSLADDLKRRIGSGIVTVVSRAEGKAAIVVGVTPDLTDRFDAVELVRAGAAALGGKGGGGRPDMAQAGGPEAEHAEAALAAVERVLAEQMNGRVAQETH